MRGFCLILCACFLYLENGVVVMCVWQDSTGGGGLIFFEGIIVEMGFVGLAVHWGMAGSRVWTSIERWWLGGCSGPVGVHGSGAC